MNLERNRAAVVLAGCLAVSVIVLVVALFATGLREGIGLNDTGLALLLLIEGNLVGVVGGYLSQSVFERSRSSVGTILTITLGLTLLIVAGFVLTDALLSEHPALSANTTKVLAALFGGIMGTMLGYMGLGRPSEPVEDQAETDTNTRTTRGTTMSTTTPDPVTPEPVEPDTSVPEPAVPDGPLAPDTTTPYEPSEPDAAPGTVPAPKQPKHSDGTNIA